MTVEKVLIMAVHLFGENKRRFHSSLEELKSLSRTAGGTVLEVVTQNRKHIHPAFYIGEGKLNEIKAIIEEKEIDVVIANDELSAGQLKNLESHISLRVIDRSQLILDIFARRAKTKEGQLQVELAQLEYTLPRLYGKGMVLSRLGGGIGTRGPGETKLETDQRHIRRKIADIKEQLKTIVKQRDQYRKRRRKNNLFQIAIVGYTNAGKSTIFNRLTESQSLEEDLLFATLDPLTRQISLPSGFQLLLTDTVGFLQKLPTTLIAAFRSTLEEVTEADFILHVVDASNPDHMQQQETVLELLEELNAKTIPTLTVYNKMDLVENDFFPTLHPSINITAYDEEDLTKLIKQIETILKETWHYFEVHVKPKDGRALNQLERETIMVDRKFDPEQNIYIVKGYIRKNHPLNNLIKSEKKVNKIP